MKPIPGYDFGSPVNAVSPLSVQDLTHLEQTLGWTFEDAQLLARHAAFFRTHAEAMVDSWRAVIARQPHLLEWFLKPDGNPDEDYKARVRSRFVQWVIDAVTRPHDRAWLNYQEEIGQRHTPQKKNSTDAGRTPSLVPLRYLLAFAPVVTDIRRFLAQGISDPTELEAVQQAWAKSVHLHVVLWSRPYTKESLW